jgi:hypothetical protein
MEKNRHSKGENPKKINFKEKKYDCEVDESETKMVLANYDKRISGGNDGSNTP